MKHMEELKEMLCRELDKVADKGELSAGDLDIVQKLTHSLKSLGTIEAMEGYSREDGYSMRGNSYARRNGRGGGGRSSRGSYNRGNSYRGNSYGYSMDDGKDEMIEHLEDMMEDAEDSKVKRAIHEAIKQIDQ